ncbi:hypothetical protein ACFY9R_26580 [Streptomyces albidoflavus]|uniref:deoxynucleotide monophosphate kinase family protein n=1 Tax=Streptomyces albidoflavus TaxID=1886 RepID=UPI00340B7D3A
MKDIALTGLARSGKDSVAASLVEDHGYVRVAFADALKDAALKADPLIPLKHIDKAVPLTTVVNFLGWERAKDAYPEVRRFLQHFGQAVRDIDPRFWVAAAVDAVHGASGGRPVVITDVRYHNEVMAVQDLGFTLVRIERPGLTPGDHVSERNTLDFDVDATIVNDGTLDDLAAAASVLVSD